MQSDWQCSDRLHVAIIMDGNGRWATRRRLPRTAGHRAGMEAVRRVAEAAADLGVGTLTLYAFSADNWKRPAQEVDALMWLFRTYLRAETPQLVEHGARLSIIGRRDRLPLRLRREIATAERATAHGRRLHIRIAIDYSSRQAIADAASRWTAGEPGSAQVFASLMAEGRDVDLLIRSGGERRLSDFLLWESAYAELWFTDVMWPDFGAADLKAALADFIKRDRRFGGLPASGASLMHSLELVPIRVEDEGGVVGGPVMRP